MHDSVITRYISLMAYATKPGAYTTGVTAAVPLAQSDAGMMETIDRATALLHIIRTVDLRLGWTGYRRRSCGMCDSVVGCGGSAQDNGLQEICQRVDVKFRKQQDRDQCCE
jgi:hypothetical protein